MVKKIIIGAITATLILIGLACVKITVECVKLPDPTQPVEE